MTMGLPKPPSPDLLREAAAAWHERLSRGAVAPGEQAAFDAWIAESPRHQAAYRSMERTWATLERMAHDPRLLELRHETALRLTRKTSGSLAPLRWVAAAALLLTVGTMGAMIIPHLSADSSPLAWLTHQLHRGTDGRYVTGTGERLSGAPEGGSQI